MKAGGEHPTHTNALNGMHIINIPASRRLGGAPVAATAVTRAGRWLLRRVVRSCRCKDAFQATECHLDRLGQQPCPWYGYAKFLKRR